MMTSLKTWCLLPLSVLLLLFIAPTLTEVVEKMSQCEGFFLNETSPQIPNILDSGNILDQNRYKVICQTYKDKRRFVTLYDTTNRIPVFSAYKFTGGDTTRPTETWMIEPELEGSNMNVPGYFHQAVENDYKNNKVYSKGHLFPSSYASDENDKKSTFTVTNIVPQVKSFNEGSWSKMERCVRCVLEKYCKNKNGTHNYVVTGAHPGTETLGKKKINIPSVLWSAFCCESQEENKWIASAHWGKNNEEESRTRYMQTKTLGELQKEMNIDAFPKSTCARDKTVAEFYPSVEENCQCPPKS